MHAAPPILQPTMERTVVLGSWLVTALATINALFTYRMPEWVVYVPFIASFVLIGLPHGAADHRVLLTLRGRPFSLLNLALVIVPYLVLAGFYAVVWWGAPLLSFFLFILITWFHWGQGDLYSLSALTGRDHHSRKWHAGAAAFIRGGLPMLVPLLAFPGVYREVTLAVVSNLGATDLTSVAVLFSDTTRLWAGLLFYAVTAVYLVSSFAFHRSWYIDLLEIALLSLFFSLVHPVLAIGVYFCLWHGMRHILRVMRLEAPRLQTSLTYRDLVQFALAAWPTTLAALALLAGLYYLVPVPPSSLDGFIGLYLVLIAVLTLPHIWVVTLMDLRDRLWTN